MTRWTKSFVKMATILTLFVLMGLPGQGFLSSADAAQLKFKDGRVWDGEILQETDKLVKFRLELGGIEQIKWVPKADLKEIVRDEDEPDKDAAAGNSDTDARHSTKPGDKDFDPDVPTLVFIPMEEMVGTYMNRKPLKEALEKAVEYGDNAVAVLVFNSGGGMLREIQPMSDIIEEYKHKIRVVAWIKSAISAAAMTSLTVEEIYFMPEGHFGACTGFYQEGGSYKLVKGDDLQQVLFMMERISERGGYDPLIMRKMQVNWFTLSADIDEDGVVTFHPDDSGEYIVSPKGEILVFNSEDAVKYGFAKGVAETEDQLADLLQLHEWQRSDVGEKIMYEWHETIRTAEKEVPLLIKKLQRAMSTIGGNEKTKKRSLGQARQYLQKLRQWNKKAEIICLINGINDETLRRLDKQIRDLARN